MGNHQPLVRQLLAITGLLLRRDWLSSQLRERPIDAFAEQLDSVAHGAERLDEMAREALVAVVAFLVIQEEKSVLRALEQCAAERELKSLLCLLRHYPAHHAVDPPSQLTRDPRGGGEVTLGERKSLARHPSRRKFEQLLKDPHPQVIRQLLINPHLTEADVIRLCTTRPARQATILTLAGFPDWLVRPRIRLAVIYNPATPSHIAVPLVALASRPELQEIADSPSLHLLLRATAQQLLSLHPPLGPATSYTLQ